MKATSSKRRASRRWPKWKNDRGDLAVVDNQDVAGQMVEYVLGGAADHAPFESGAGDRAHDYEVCFMLARECRENFARAPGQ